MRWLPVGVALLALGCAPGMGSIGAMMGKRHEDGRVVVREVPPDMASARAGLKPGDEIMAIDGRDARRMTAREIHDSMVGPVGSEVQLTVLRGEEVLRLQVKRGPLK